MKLFLASQAKHPATIKKMGEYVGGFQGKNLAYIPTAANGESAWESWKEGESWKLVNTLGALVRPVQLEGQRPATALEALKDADLIWMAGGACGYLMYWLRRMKLDTHIKKLLERSIYIGSSSGSMITSAHLATAEWCPGEEEYGASIIPGLGLVDFDIYPHYFEEDLTTIKQHYKGNKLYMLKDGEEIIVEDGKVAVIGQERIFTPV